MGLDRLASALDDSGVLTRLVEGSEGGPELPADRLVRLSRDAADREDRRPRLLGERRSIHTGPDIDERAGGRVPSFAAELEDGVASCDEVELLVPVVRLVVLVDDPIACLGRGPGVDAEGRDAEAMPDRTPRLTAVAELLDLVEMRY